MAAEDAKTVAPADVTAGLPDEIARFARRDVVTDQQHASFIQGGGHGGSYPHLVHEYIRSIVDKRRPIIDIVKAANWSAVGFCAHESAMAGGREIIIPDYSAL
jgi:hypothetical protein